VIFNAALEQKLLVALHAHGPIDVEIHESEYRQHLLLQMRSIWQRTQSWSPREQQIVLLFFRGYSFFRELSEIETEFWASLYKELQLADANLTNAHYDLLEKALKSDPRIKDLFIRTTRSPLVKTILSSDTHRREFVKTIDAIWGIRSLNARTLEKMFRHYYFAGIESVDEKFIHQTLLTEPAVVIERTIRQKASYNRIFGGLKEAIIFILEQKIPADPLDGLSERVRLAGHTLSDPNPIEFFRNKAEKALRNLLGSLSGVAKTATPTQRTEQIELEEEEETTQRKKRREFQVTIQYPENTVEYGNPFRLEFANILVGRRVLQLTGATTKKIEVSGSSAVFMLEVGETHAQLFVDGEPATAKKRLNCLPQLIWTFFDHRHEPLRARPLEPQTLFARIELEDGCFVIVPWQARWDESGMMVRGASIDVQLEQYQIQATLLAPSHGIRFLAADETPLSVLQNRECKFKILPPETTATHRVQLGSGSEFVPLEQWHTLHDNQNDELVIECQTQTGWWQVVGRIALELPIVLHEIKLEGRVLWLHASAPKDAHWKVEFEDSCQLLPMQVAPSQVTLLLKRLWTRQTIVVELVCKAVVYHRQVLVYTPNLANLLMYELPTGLGWGALR
jgi:hypothetical protein